ncbi:MAG: hypothetical protein ACI3W5_08530 [Faecousia sp.]
MEKYSEMMEDIAAAVQGIELLKKQALKHYTRLVDEVLADRLTDETSIERIMDGLADFGDYPEFLVLYRKLCRHVYYHYPALVGKHVTWFRALFMTNDEDSTE